MVSLGRHLEYHPPMPQAGAPSTRPDCFNPIQPGVQQFQGWGIHSVLGQQVPVPHHTHSENFFLISALNLTWECPESLWISPVRETPPSLWRICPSVQSSTQNLQIRLEGSTEDHQVQTPCSGRVTRGTWHRIVSRGSIPKVSTWWSCLFSRLNRRSSLSLSSQEKRPNHVCLST